MGPLNAASLSTTYVVLVAFLVSIKRTMSFIVSLINQQTLPEMLSPGQKKMLNADLFP